MTAPRVTAVSERIAASIVAAKQLRDAAKSAAAKAAEANPNAATTAQQGPARRA